MATLQQGVNEEFMEMKSELEVTRDFELTKLRLWEEYQVKRCEDEYKSDLQIAKENHDKMVKLIKEKLYDKLQNEIKQLKEDKLLLNLVNANSWGNSLDPTTVALNSIAGSTLNDRRSLRKREFSRFTSGEAEDLSDGGSGNTTSGYFSSNGKRRRHYATRYSSNDETSSVQQSHNHSKLNQNGLSSGNDSNLSDKDYDALNSIIMNNEDGGVSLILADKRQQGKTTRNNNKQFVGVQGLKPEELNDDLNLLRGAMKFEH